MLVALQQQALACLCGVPQAAGILCWFIVRGALLVVLHMPVAVRLLRELQMCMWACCCKVAHEGRGRKSLSSEPGGRAKRSRKAWGSSFPSPSTASIGLCLLSETAHMGSLFMVADAGGQGVSYHQRTMQGTPASYRKHVWQGLLFFSFLINKRKKKSILSFFFFFLGWRIPIIVLLFKACIISTSMYMCNCSFISHENNDV